MKRDVGPKRQHDKPERTVRKPLMSTGKHQFSIGLPLVLWTTAGCIKNPDACAVNCQAYSTLVETCLDEWRDQHNVTPVCYNGYSTTWYDEYGKLKSDNPDVLDAYHASGRDCESGDDAYASCMEENDIKASVAADAGNTQARQEGCEAGAVAEENDPSTQAMHALDCLGFLEAVGLATENP